MSERVTAVAPANIALVKYWGMRSEEPLRPWNRSISMTLSRSVSTTTVALLGSGREDEVFLAGETGELRSAPGAFVERVVAQLRRLRQRAGRQEALRVATRNSFPAAAGLASSASGFAALTVAAAELLGLGSSPDLLSTLARDSGSGSAARSVLGGFVEWPGEEEPESPARQLFAATHWELCDLIAIVDERPKAVSSRAGHRAAPSSPLFAARQERLPARLAAVREALRARSLADLGPPTEADAAELHTVALTASPPVVYWRAGTLEVLRAVGELRSRGVSVYWTMDAGPNVHLLCEPAQEEEVAVAIERLSAVRRLIRDRVGTGPRLSEEHLF